MSVFAGQELGGRAETENITRLDLASYFFIRPSKIVIASVIQSYRATDWDNMTGKLIACVAAKIVTLYVGQLGL